MNPEKILSKLKSSLHGHRFDDRAKILELLGYTMKTK